MSTEQANAKVRAKAAAAAAAAVSEERQRLAADKEPNVLMTKDGQQAEVANNESVAIMQSLGWVLKG